MQGSPPENAVVRRPRARRSRGLALAAVALLCGGLACLGASWLLESDDGLSAGAAPASEAVTTPLLSARRVPQWTTAPVSLHALAAALQPVADAAPPSTCIGVGDGSVTLYSHNGDLPLVPASNQKLLTAAAALDILGADTTLTTSFRAATEPAAGVLEGDLYVLGGGDPLLTTEAYQRRQRHGRLPETDLEAVADQLAATGLRQVTGSIVGDASRYDDERGHPSWSGRWVTNGEVAPLSALLVNDAWLIDPVTGEGPGGAATDPAAHAAGVLTRLLSERGVTVGGPPLSGRTPDGAVALLDVPSLPVSAIAGEVLEFSDNTSSELLLKEIGLAASGEGSTAAGAAAVTDWATAEGLAIKGSTVVDGSGLSPSNRVTCALLASVLRSGGSEGELAENLAVPGAPGTLADRFEGGEWALRLRAKTGSLNDVTSLSGWLISRPGATFDFQIVTNTGDRRVNADDKALQTLLLTALLDQPVAPPLDAAGPTPPTEA